MNRIAQIAEKANKLRRSENAEYRLLCLLDTVSSPLPPRFLTKVSFQPDGCWIWTGGVNKNAFYAQHFYGIYCPNPKQRPIRTVYAHRLSYELHKGPVPEGLEIDHLCHNKLCVNPAHLEAVTHRENCRRRKQSGPAKGFKWVFIDGRRAFMRRLV